MDVNALIQQLAELGQAGKEGADELRQAISELDEEMDTLVLEGMEWIASLYEEMDTEETSKDD
jgi:hypothetical protein